MSEIEAYPLLSRSPLLLFGPRIQEYQELGPDPSLPDAHATRAEANSLADHEANVGLRCVLPTLRCCWIRSARAY